MYKESKELYALTLTINSLSRLTADMIAPKRAIRKFDQDEGHYPFIPASELKFIGMMNAIAKYINTKRVDNMDDMKFLDVGCGLGTKVVLASHWFGWHNTYGLELFPPYVEFAQRWFTRTGIPHNHLIEADAITYDGYGNYDVIYFYHPMHKHDMQVAFQQNLIDTVKSGAIIVARMVSDGAHVHMRDAKGIKKIDEIDDCSNIYVKK